MGTWVSVQRPVVACSTFISFSKTEYTFIIRWITVLSYKIFPRIPCICGAQWDINRSCLFSLFPSSFPPPCLEHRYDGWTSRCHFINKRTRLTPWGWQKGKVLVTQSCLTLCGYGAASHQAPLSMEFSRQEYWSGQPFPSPGDLPDPGIELQFPSLQADSLLSDPRKPQGRAKRS